MRLGGVYVWNRILGQVVIDSTRSTLACANPARSKIAPAAIGRGGGRL